ncbi:MAG: hypothetical protein RL490_1670 [Pseudomonadota bacterium]
MFIRLTPAISVSPQISVSDCARARDEGFAAIICNRPDDETLDQPSAAMIAAAAHDAGLRFVHIPVDASGINSDQVAAMAAALAESDRVLAYCRSGTRSTNLWALAEASRGGDPDAIVAAAEAGGYNVGGMLPMLRRLAAGA